MHNPWAFRPLFQAPCRHAIYAEQCRNAKSHRLVFPSPVTWGKKVTLPLSLPSSPAEEQWPGAGLGPGSSVSSSQPSPTSASQTRLLVKSSCWLCIEKREKKEEKKEREGKTNLELCHSCKKVLGGRKAELPWLSLQQLVAVPALRLLVFFAGVWLSITTYLRRFLIYFWSTSLWKRFCLVKKLFWFCLLNNWAKFIDVSFAWLLCLTLQFNAFLKGKTK